MAQVLIDDRHLHDIGDAIRKVRGTHDLVTPDSMAYEIEHAEIVYPDDYELGWQRPLDWPDYSQIDLTNFEGMYYTYDTTGADNYGSFARFYCSCSGGYKVEKGDIVNGQFVATSSRNVSSGGTYEEWIAPTITGYVVYRITAQTAGSPITSIGHRDLPTSMTGTTRIRRYQLQPILERYGRLPNLTGFSNWANYSVVSDTILDLEKLTSFSGVWTNSPRIENINISGFDSRVTSLNQTFYRCKRLRWLNETDKLCTSACTTLNASFYECNKLLFIDSTNWNTSNVTTMATTFYNCFNLYKLDVSNFDVSKVMVLNSIFTNCTKLKVLDTSNWVVTLPTNYSGVFYGCYAVEELDVSGFNSANVTNMTQMFYNCMSLKRVDVSHFNTSKVTTINGMFYNCRSLDEIDVSHFDTSKVTTVNQMFYYTVNLKSLDVSNFDLSLCTNIAHFVNWATSFGTVTLPANMTTGTITGTNMDSAFSNLLNIERIDLSGCDFSGVTAPASTFRYDYCVEEIILPTSLKYIGQTFFGDCTNLETIVLPSTTLVTLTNTNAFSGANRAKTIYVPDNLVASYRTATNWKSLSNVTFAGLSTYTGGA